jgi:diguanylate cyclase (GGDEF)-like protein
MVSIAAFARIRRKCAPRTLIIPPPLQGLPLTSMSDRHPYGRAAGRLLAGLAFACLAAAAVQAAPYPAPMQTIQDALLDDPAGAEALAQRQLAASRIRGDADAEFWQLLALAAVHTMREQPAKARRDVEEARALLLRLPREEGVRRRLWVESYAIGASFHVEDLQLLIKRSSALRSEVAALGDAVLLCEIAGGDVWLLREAGAPDEAWTAAEEAERCGRRQGQAGVETAALITLGGIAGTLPGKAPSADYFERATEALGARPARFQRSWIEWEQASTLAREGQVDAARTRFERSLGYSRALGDSTGAAATALDLAALQLRAGDTAGALGLVRGALRLLNPADAPERVATARGLAIEALTIQKRPEVLHEIDLARPLQSLPLSPLGQARLARRFAEGYASQGLYAQAYTELLRSTQAVTQSQQALRDAQMLRLQARYENAQRDAENAELRHHAQAARLEIEAREAQQRALWIALAALAVLLAAAGWFAVRMFARRRQMTTLAMRDELTGLPNRRAVLAFAQEQFRLAQRLGFDLAVAIVDLDHFKQVNDTYGHAGGDAVLKAFASAAGDVLRGQDRMGRYGGEEWLLVMPGAGMAELGPIFERLRSNLSERTIEGLPVPHGVTFSMGGAASGKRATTLEALIDEADRQLYCAKAEGRDALRYEGRDATKTYGGAMLAPA